MHLVKERLEIGPHLHGRPIREVEDIDQRVDDLEPVPLVNRVAKFSDFLIDQSTAKLQTVRCWHLWFVRQREPERGVKVGDLSLLRT